MVAQRMDPRIVIGDRFELEREAGSGGMGTVFRARDRETGGLVALKLLRDADEIHAERFLREAAFLADLRHPAIVRYVAHGVAANGHHYLAMEWLDGEDLAARLHRQRLSGDECLVLLRQMTTALAFAHRCGLVHRDVKPSNLFLPDRDVARVKLVDFGIAHVARDVQRLTQTGVVLGTPGYMAPEQIQGTPGHDPRSDVFALGCVFFECVAGRPAFAGPHAMAVLAQILTKETPRARAARADVSGALDALIARMMSKDPARRPADASAVAVELARLGPLFDPTVRLVDVSATTMESVVETQRRTPRSSKRAPAGPRSVALVLGRPTSYVGRNRELALLDGVLAECVAESAATVALVTGPAGAGKSRLLRELLERVERRGDRVEVLYGRADPLGASSPLGIVAGAVRRAAGIEEGDAAEARRRKLEERLQRRLAGAELGRAAAFLGELAGCPFPGTDDQALRAARADAKLMSDGVRAAWEEWLAAECAAQPVVLALEDLHWSDAATVRLVGDTLRALRDSPLLVLALARPEVHAQFPDLWAEHDVEHVRLRPLSRKASGKLVEAAPGGKVSPDVVAEVVERADGNPFYLEELIRAVAAGRHGSLPDSVLGTVEARIEAEGARGKRLLQVASVFGDRFSRIGVAALLAPAELPEAVGERLAALADREIIAPASSPAPGGDACYVFCHALVRETAYATLPDAERAASHRLAGEWLERTGGADAATLAEHFRRGGEPARAVRWYRRAAEQALDASDLVAALACADRGAACGATGLDLGALLLIEAEASLWRGEIVQAEQRGLTAMGILPVGSAAWFRALTQVVIAAGKLGGFDRVEGWVGPARAAGPAPDARGARIICLLNCATQLIFGGRYAAADAIDDALRAAAGDPAGLEARIAAQLHEMRAIRASHAGDLGACLAGLEASLAAYEQAGDRRNVCVTRSNLGFIFAELGDFAGAEEALGAALAAAERMGILDVVASVLQNLGLVLAHRGRLDEAMILERRALAEFERQGDPRMAGVARTYVAKIALLSADPAGAEREARAAAAALAVTPPLRAAAVAVLARALLRSGRAAEALAAAREAFATLEELGTLEEGESLVRLVHAEALAATGAAAELERAIAGAQGRLLERAAKISDPVWRERFLSGVPDNARTLALGGAV